MPKANPKAADAAELPAHAAEFAAADASTISVEWVGETQEAVTVRVTEERVNALLLDMREMTENVVSNADRLRKVLEFAGTVLGFAVKLQTGRMR